MANPDSFGTYTVRSRDWSLRCADGKSLSKGIGACGLSIGGKAISLRVLAEKQSVGNQKARKMSLQLTLTGVELSFEVGKDLLEAVTGLSIAYTKPDTSNSVPVYINSKNPALMNTTDFFGPCALITYSVAEASLLKDLGKYQGRTFLLFNMGSVVADRSPDWLTKVIDATDGKSTLGGCFKAFNAQGSVFNNAFAAVKLDTTDFALSAKLKGAGIGLFSGSVTMTSFT